MIKVADKTTLNVARIVAGAAFAFGIGYSSVAMASPEEEEIARLNRVRANLFEELVKTRGELASVREELAAALKARETAEAELARTTQQTALPARAMPNSTAPATERQASADPNPMRPAARPAIAPSPTARERPSSATSAPSISAARREAANVTVPKPRVRSQAEARRSIVAAPASPSDFPLPSSLRLRRP